MNKSAEPISWGHIDGKEILLYTLSNDAGMQLRVLNYGGIVQSLYVSDKNGELKDIVLGYSKLADYIIDPFYIGAIAGRYANRIANGRFNLNGSEYYLPQNNGSNCLHGGINGFNKKVFDAETFQYNGHQAIRLSLLSKDGDEGFPGNLSLEVIYAITDKNEWIIEYRVTADKDTVVNITQHTYFNLSAVFNRSILGHQLKINAEYYLPQNEAQVPLGYLEAVLNTPFDFTAMRSIGEEINAAHPQFIIGNGFDHTWVFNNDKAELKEVAELFEPATGIRMKVLTTEPSAQLYTGNYLNDEYIGKNNIAFTERCGLCFETQHYPDAPNQASFPSTLLKAGEQFFSKTIYKF